MRGKVEIANHTLDFVSVNGKDIQFTECDSFNELAVSSVIDIDLLADILSLCIDSASGKVLNIATIEKLNSLGLAIHRGDNMSPVIIP